MSTISLNVTGKIAKITINRADKRNALNKAMWQQLADFCDQLANDIKPRVVVFQAQGDKAFSAGADIAELTEMLASPELLQQNNDIVQQAQLKLQRLPCVTIAAINGACFGGGLGIALCCDFRIAAAHATFAITPAKLGLLYSIEDTQRLVQTVGLPTAKAMLYLGKAQTAEQALKNNLIHQMVESSELDSAVQSIINDIVAASSSAIQGMKQTLAYLMEDPTLPQAEIRLLSKHAFDSKDFKKASQAFITKTRVEFD
ncbi:enoyl-CoA hydratase/isomerase family protein [Shewanella glacialipiscicola]|uniref:Enoyl-CoA hydratase n=1 Tax=Shewanella glacialipiscicola TaxID=614069 RepID=A0ABQ6J234_9GAMM|nr:enoyl-CoA hydratase/isomerase family protein [Shewanella glacialipiscicola]MCL1087425.1 enoyl-CoA hydratase/isomerase family protein [Shewanella glacialipiscicola]GIU19778.1 enoyl-CoA hydratase [Shewanella glacialipiscicola]GMA82168.1 enoyl-CoA hydratase [Shewanella glacialipiscicola]